MAAAVPSNNKEEDNNRGLAQDTGIKVEFKPGKVGGSLWLRSGAQLTVPPEVLDQRDIITCIIVPPSHRPHYRPNNVEYGKLVSDVYLVHSKYALKAPVRFAIPWRYDGHHNYLGMKLYYRMLPHDWLPYDYKREGDTIWCDIFSSGLLALVWTPPEEIFDLSPDGGLQNFKIETMASVRIAKRSTNVHASCRLRVLPIFLERIKQCLPVYPMECNDAEHLSPIYEFHPSSEPNLRRPVTIKLPLPSWVSTSSSEPKQTAGHSAHCDPNDLLIFYQDWRQEYAHDGVTTTGMPLRQEWSLVQSQLKFTQTSVTFDTKAFGRFIMVKARENRMKLLPRSLTRMEYCNHVILSHLLVFLLMDERRWYVWMETAPTTRLRSVLEEKKQQGFILIKVMENGEMTGKLKEENNFGRRGSKRKIVRDAAAGQAPPDHPYMEITNGSGFRVTLTGDVQVKTDQSPQNVLLAKGANWQPLRKSNNKRPVPTKKKDDEENEKPGSSSSSVHRDGSVELRYDELLSDNYRFFPIEPSSDMLDKLVDTVEHRHKNGNHISNGKENGKSETNETDENNADSRVGEYCGILRCQWLPPSPREIPMDEERLEEVKEKVVPMEFQLRFDFPEMMDYFGLNEASLLTKAEERRKLAQSRSVESQEETKKRVLSMKLVEEEKARLQKLMEEERAAKERESRIAAMKRLTEPMKPQKQLTREAKVLSGRSLQVLSRYVEQGLTLAVHLDIPENVLTGFGMDSLFNSSGLNDLTYKVLLHWKRRFPANDKKNMVPALLRSLREMGLEEVAKVVEDCDAKNLELSNTAFQSLQER